MRTYRNILQRLHRGQSGQVFILTMVLVLIAGLLLTPMARLLATGARSDMTYHTKTDELYAADAGVEDARWMVKYSELADAFPDYLSLNFNDSWDYDLPAEVNGIPVNVSLQNVWIPYGIPMPSVEQGDIVLNGIPSPAALPPKVIITSSVTDAGLLELKIQYYPYDEEELGINTIGIWLPPGYHYNTAAASDLDAYDAPRQITGHAGGEAVVWDFSEYLNGYPFAGQDPLPEFPGVDADEDPLCSSITLPFTATGTNTPQIIAWVDTNLDLTYGLYEPYSCAWDADTSIFKILSDAGNTEIEAYTGKDEIRQFGAAVGGDYYATGNSLIGGSVGSKEYHDQLYSSTTARVRTSGDGITGIPAGAKVEAAYLYWTGWIGHNNFNPAEAQAFSDSCSNFDKWNRSGSNRWSISSGKFRGQGGGTNDQRTVTMKDSLDLSAAATAEVSWQQTKSGTLEQSDGLYYAFSGNGGSTWSQPIEAFKYYNPPSSFTCDVPALYLTDAFKMRLYFTFNSSDEYVYIDNITISKTVSLEYPENPTPAGLAKLVEKFARVNKVLFNGEPVTADVYQTLYPDAFEGTAYEDTWYYTATADVTGLVTQWADNGEYDIAFNGAGDYTLGHYYVGDNPEEDNYRYNAYQPGYYHTFDDRVNEVTGYPLGTPSPPDPEGENPYQAAHAGWSLIIVYSSPETLGHQLYLYDIKTPDFKFFFGWNGGNIEGPALNHDFDGDGNPGGTISGFMVPERVPGESLAGRITCFVGEGDNWMTGDSLKVKGTPLSNSASSASNVWNSRWDSDSPGLTVTGVDIDTFDIAWGILNPGDTSVDVDIPTRADGFTMVYIILSFRSDTATGGVLSYLIR